MPEHTRAIEAAREIIERFEVTEPPVPLLEIVRHYGLDVQSVRFKPEHDNISGFLDLKRQAIMVNSAEVERRQAFTIAHELGHWVLHKDQLPQRPDLAIMHRTEGIGGRGTDPLEIEANRFAGELLVPRSMLERFKDLPNKQLSRLFGVTEKAIEVRIVQEFRVRTGSLVGKPRAS